MGNCRSRSGDRILLEQSGDHRRVEVGVKGEGKDRRLLVQLPSQSLLLQRSPFLVDRLHYVWALRRETAIEGQGLSGVIRTISPKTAMQPRRQFLPGDRYGQ
jgi:hypothetical protein